MIEVSVHDDFMYGGLRFGFRMKFEGQPTRYATGVDQFGNLVWEELSQEQLMLVRTPALTLEPETARALMDALARHFGGITDTQLIQKAYAKEQERVDKMLDRFLDLTSIQERRR